MDLFKGYGKVFNWKSDSKNMIEATRVEVYSALDDQYRTVADVSHIVQFELGLRAKNDTWIGHKNNKFWGLNIRSVFRQLEDIANTGEADRIPTTLLLDELNNLDDDMAFSYKKREGGTGQYGDDPLLAGTGEHSALQ